MTLAENNSDSPGARKNVVSMAKAQRDLARQRRMRDDPEPLQPRGKDKVLAGRWNKDMFGMPSDDGCACPVEPIGFAEGQFYLVDSKGLFRTFSARDFTQDGIQDLFSAYPNYPKWMHPRFGKARKIKEPETGEEKQIFPIDSFDRDAIKETLFLACTRKGFFSPSDKMRGRGAWTTRAGGLVYHAGEAIWEFDGKKFIERATGVREGQLYPRLASLPEPWTEPFDALDNPARILLRGFQNANWTRPLIDPILLLGWIGAAYLGGALDWRPSMVLLGDKGTGKSTLQNILKDLFGEALFHSSDTSAAGIYQSMAHDSRAVAIDELEPGADPRKVAAVADLMRTSASGAIGRRGSSGGEASQFQMRSAFLFSAINNPLHNAADLSRCCFLRLQPFSANSTRPPAINAETTGPMVLAQMMRGWGARGENFAMKRKIFADALAAGGHDKRGQDTYGILLACASLMLGDELAEEMDLPLAVEREREWTELLAADALPEVEDAKPNYRKCVDSILTAQVDVWRHGHRNTVGKAISDLIDAEKSAQPLEGYDRASAKRDIELAGLGLRTAREIVTPHARESRAPIDKALQFFGLDDDGLHAANYVLCVPNDSPLMARLLRGTAFEQSGWKDALRQCPIPGVVLTDKSVNRITINGVRARCTLVVLAKYHEAPER